MSGGSTAGFALAGASLLSALIAGPVPSQVEPASTSAEAPPTSVVTAADGREIRITPFVGASVQIEHGGRVLHVDPWSRGDYSSALPADLVLVTDTPPDHLDPEMLLRIRKPDAVVILSDRPEDARDEGGRERLLLVVDRIGGMARIMDNGDAALVDGIRVEAVAMYDLIPGQPFHARGEGNGYVVTLGGTRIYLSGVTECTDEMLAVENVDVLFVPMNLPNGRMPPETAAECVRRIGPDIVYPYHYREQPIDDFVEALEDHPVEVRVFDWYSR